MTSPHQDSLIETLQLVAADWHVQVASLPSYAHVPFEIARTLSEEIEVMSQINLVTWPIVSDSVEAIGNVFNDLSEDVSFWTIEALQTSPIWQQQREKAQAALAQLGEPVRAPNRSNS